MPTSAEATTLKSSVPILTIAGRDSELHKIAGTQGGEWAGPCPKCGGTDRFHLQERGLWMCRSCHPRWADVIEYVQWRHGFAYARAVEYLSGSYLPAVQQARRQAGEPARRDPKEPPQAWKDSAVQYSAACIIALWSEVGTRALNWLHKRGLDDATIKRYRLGYNPAERWEQWGERRVALERGIVIPRYMAGEHFPRFFNVRRPVGDPKYRGIAGGQMIAFGLDQLGEHTRAVLTEGEFDAMLVSQQASEMAGAFTMGGANTGMDTVTLGKTLALEVVYIVYDNDEPGQKGAAKMAAESTRFRLAKVPNGINDLSELHQKGGSIRALVQELVTPMASKVEQAKAKFERTPAGNLFAPPSKTIRERVIGLFVARDGWAAEEAVGAIADWTEEECQAVMDDEDEQAKEGGEDEIA